MNECHHAFSFHIKTNPLLKSFTVDSQVLFFPRGASHRFINIYFLFGSLFFGNMDPSIHLPIRPTLEQYAWTPWHQNICRRGVKIEKVHTILSEL